MAKLNSKILTSSAMALRQGTESQSRQREGLPKWVTDARGAQPWLTCEPSGRIMRPAEVFDRVRLSKSQVYEMIANGTFPPFIKISARASGMPEAWLDCFIAARARDAIDASSR